MSLSQRMGTIYPGAPGATGRQARARSLAGHATSNTTEETNDRCRTPDDSTAEDEHSDHNRTAPATRQAPAWASFTFQGLGCQLRHASHGRFVKARPARPSSTRLRSRRARQPQSGGSIVAQTKTHTEPHRRIARNDWRNHGAHYEMRRARGQPGPRRVDDGDRDAGVHKSETRRSQARPRGWCHCSSESGSYRQRQASGCYRKPAPTIILVFRNLEEAANLFQGHYQQQFHPVPLLHSPSEHAIRLLVAH